MEEERVRCSVKVLREHQRARVPAEDELRGGAHSANARRRQLGAHGASGTAALPAVSAAAVSGVPEQRRDAHCGVQSVHRVPAHQPDDAKPDGLDPAPRVQSERDFIRHRQLQLPAYRGARRLHGPRPDPVVDQLAVRLLPPLQAMDGRL